MRHLLVFASARVRVLRRGRTVVAAGRDHSTFPAIVKGLLPPLLMALNLCTFAPAAAQAPLSAGAIEVVPSLGHSAGVTSVAFSADGRMAVSGSWDKTLKLWDVASGRLLRTFAGHSDQVASVAFAPDGRTVLSGSEDHTVKLWDIASGRLLRTFEHSQAVRAVAFAPDGRTALSGGGDTTLKLWEVASGRLLRTFGGSSKWVLSVAFTPDGRTAVSGSEDKTLLLWDAASGRLLRTFAEHSDMVLSVTFAPNGRTVLAGCRSGALKLWDVASGRPLRIFEGHSHGVNTVAFVLSGRTAVSGSGDKTLKLWDVASGRLLRTIEAHSDMVLSAAFAPDGRTLLSGGGDNSLNLWNVASGKLLHNFGSNSAVVFSVAFAADGRTVLSGSLDHVVRLWDAASGRLTRTFAGHSDVINSVAFAPDGRTLLSAGKDYTVKLWDAASGHLTRTFGEGSGFVTFAPDGQTVLSGGRDGILKLWDVASGRLLRNFEGHSGWDHSVAFAPDGRTVLSGNLDRTLKLWDVATGRLLRAFEGHSGQVLSVAFAPDGRTVLSGSGDKTLKLWDVATGRLLRTFEGHSDRVWSVAFAPDGRTVLSGSGDKTLKLWDVATGRLLRTFAGHSGVYSLAFAPNGRTILSGSEDASIRFWSSATGELLATMMHFDGGDWVTITPEGFFDASDQGAQMLSVVRGLEVYSIDQFYQALHRPDLVREKLAGDLQGRVKAAAAKLDLSKAVASGPAPRVRIAAPLADVNVREDRIPMEAVIADAGGGIGNVEWRVNGVTLGLDQRGLSRIDDGSSNAGERRIARVITLTPGENKVEVVAYNAQGLIASMPAMVTITREGAAGSVRLYVLAVGIDDYWDSRLQLRFAGIDAKSIGDALARAGETLFEQVKVTRVLDGEATVANLDRVFTELGREVRPQDVFVFFLAGHGKTVDGRYYFLPQDFRYEGEESIVRRGVGQDRWQDWFARIGARKSVWLYDTCESGSMTGDLFAQRGLEGIAAVDRLARAMGRTVLAATTDDAPALEGYRGHGLFTYAILDALGRADSNNDGLIEVTELASYIDQQVPELSQAVFKRRQVPQMKIQGSNFAVARTVGGLVGADAPPLAVPTKPTHVILGPAEIHELANSRAPVVLRLPSGAHGVVLIESAGGWVLVARDGKKLGYVEERVLQRLQ